MFGLEKLCSEFCARQLHVGYSQKLSSWLAFLALEAAMKRGRPAGGGLGRRAQWVPARLEQWTQPKV